MSKPRYPWWSYAKSMAYRYPELCAKQKVLHDTTITPAYGGTLGGGERTDKTADAALRELPKVNQRELDAVRAAIRYIEGLPSGKERMEIVKLYYWQRSHTLFGAANAIHISEKTALRWNRDFIMRVAENFGLIER